MKMKIKMNLMMWGSRRVMTKMLSGANLPPIEALMDGDLQEWQGAPATTSGRHCFILDPTLDILATHSL